MVAIGTALLGIAAWFGLVWWWRRRRLPRTAWFLRAVGVSGAAAVVAMEGGWVTTEVGRQPWIVYGLMRTEETVSPAGGLAWGLAAVTVVYSMLTFFTVVVLRRLARGRDTLAPQEEGATRAAGRGSDTMTLAYAVLGAAFVGLIAYSLFGGADFGGGIWDLLAGGTERGRAVRERVEHSIGPVWEANHVWLIFVLVVYGRGSPEGSPPPSRPSTSRSPPPRSGSSPAVRRSPTARVSEPCRCAASSGRRSLCPPC